MFLPDVSHARFWVYLAPKKSVVMWFQLCNREVVKCWDFLNIREQHELSFDLIFVELTIECRAVDTEQLSGFGFVALSRL